MNTTLDREELKVLIREAVGEELDERRRRSNLAAIKAGQAKTAAMFAMTGEPRSYSAL